MPSPDARRPVALVVLDGWGEAPVSAANAVTSPGVTRLPALAAGSSISGLLAASGNAVGLPDGIMGNSEVGHLTLGCGRVVAQDLVRISGAVRTGSITHEPEFLRLVEATCAGSGRLHLIGLCSDAGVHSDLAHLEGIARALAAAGVCELVFHPFTDGRDTPPTSATRHVARLQALVDSLPGARVGTLGGRYFGMDRDQHWERVERAVRALVLGEGPRFPTAAAAVDAAHSAGVTDEFIPPAVISAEGTLREGDAVLFVNFRADRVRQLARVLTQADFSAFNVPVPRLARVTGLTLYEESLNLPVMFPPHRPQRTLGEEFARAGWPQLRLAETEKYAHVTYFFNGGREEPFPGEERCLVPSPRVATYDLTPAMAALEITAKAVQWLRQGGGRLLVMNYANADMVGHTGDLPATQQACRIVDEQVGLVIDAAREVGAVLAITADHGNAECMLDESGGPLTAHTLAPVPVIIAAPGLAHRHLAGIFGLADVAPTLLRLAGLPVPEAMTGRNLLDA